MRRSGQLRSGQLRSGQLRSWRNAQIGAAQIGAAQIGAAQIGAQCAKGSSDRGNSDLSCAGTAQPPWSVSPGTRAPCLVSKSMKVKVKVKVPVSRSGPIKGTGTAPPWRHRLDNCDLSPLTKIPYKKPIIVHSEFDKCVLQILPQFAVFSTILPSYTLRSLALFSHILPYLALFSHNLRSLAPSTKQSPRSCWSEHCHHQCPNHLPRIKHTLPQAEKPGLGPGTIFI